jgi:protein disulfide-isomerase
MKATCTIRSFFFLLLSVAFCQAGEFFTDFEEAKVLAQKEKKALLVKFTGSDWCRPCQLLDQEVFSQKEFKDAIQKDCVIVILDFPQKKVLPQQEQEKNSKIRDDYEVKGYPTVLLMNAQGQVFKRTGYQPGGVKPYLEMLQISLRAQDYL